MGVSVTQLVAEVSISGADTAKTNLREVGTAATTLQETLNTIKPYNAGNAVTDVDVAQAKLTLLEEKVSQARDKLMTLQNAANAGESVSGIPEAEANLVLLQDKAQQARAGLEELKTGAVDASEGMQTLKQGASEAEEATGGGFLSAIRETAGGLVDFVGKIGMGVMSAQMIWGTVKNVTSNLIQSAQQNQQAQAQTAAAIRSTGDASGMTVSSISNLATSLSNVTDFSKDTVQQGENMLLTFTGIGKQVFPDTTKTMLDMAQAMHQGPTQAAMMLGKALGDPTTGLTALQRVGVSFSAQEKEQIKTMMAHNDVVGAQKVMLKELSTEFGGSASAAGKTFAGALDIAKNRLENFEQNMGTALLPVLTNLMNMVSSNVMPILQKFGDWFTNTAIPSLEHFGSSLGKAFQSGPVQMFLVQAKGLGDQLGFLFNSIRDVAGMLLGQFGFSMSGASKQANDLASGALKALTDIMHEASVHIHNVAVTLNQMDFGEIIDGAKQAGSSMLSMMPGVNLIQVLMKHSQDLANWWQSSVIPTFKQAEPGFINLGQALAGLLPVIEHIASVIHDSMQHAFEAMLPVMEKAIPIIIKIAGIVSDGLGTAIKFLTPYIMQAVDAIGKFAGEIVDRVAPIVSQWLDNLNKGIDGFMAVWKVVWPYASQILKGVWDEIMGIVKIAWAIVEGIIKIGLDLLSGNWQQAWTDFKDMLAGIWEGIKTYLNGAWEIIKGIFSGAYTAIVNGVMGFKNTIMDHFNEIKDGAGGIFHDLINGIIDHLNDGISAVEGFVNGFGNAIDAVSEKLGAGDIIATVHIGRIPHYSDGTPAGGHPGGPALVGEQGPEIAMLPPGTSVLPAGQTKSLLKAMGVPGYAGGVGDALGDFFSWIGSGASSLLNNVLGALHIGAPSLPGALNDMSAGILSKLKDTAVDWIGKHMPSFNFGGGSGGSPVNVPGNVQSWITAAMAATGVPGNWAGALATIAMNESGGNPNAENDWDINALNGDPSRGLFQTIGATFAAYALPGHGNILNPIDNAIAAIRYIQARYGSVFNVPGIQSIANGGGYVGYANGTNFNPVEGDYLVGERGPEVLRIPRGASVIPNHLLGSSSGPQIIVQPAPVYLDGRLLAQGLMPYIVDAIRYGTGSTGM
jgi:phage-related protein